MNTSPRRRGRRSRPMARGPRAARIGVALAVGLLAIGLTVAMPRVFSETLTAPEPRYVAVTVAPGQTLWDIAAAHKSPRGDIRAMVDRIRAANDLSDATVQPGQVLRVPTAATR